MNHVREGGKKAACEKRHEVFNTSFGGLSQEVKRGTPTTCNTRNTVIL